MDKWTSFWTSVTVSTLLSGHTMNILVVTPTLISIYLPIASSSSHMQRRPYIFIEKKRQQLTIQIYSVYFINFSSLSYETLKVF